MEQNITTPINISDQSKKKRKWYISPHKMERFFRESGAQMLELNMVPLFTQYLENVVVDITMKAVDILKKKRKVRVQKKHIIQVLETYQLPPF